MDDYQQDRDAFEALAQAVRALLALGYDRDDVENDVDTTIREWLASEREQAGADEAAQQAAERRLY